MKDMHNSIAVDLAVGPAVLNADNEPLAIDLAGYKSAEVIIAAGTGGINFTANNKIEFKVTHSEDGQTYKDVTALDMLGVEAVTGGVVKAFTEAHPNATVYRLGYKGNRRFLKVLADFSGTHGTGTPLAVIVIKGEPRYAPTV